MTSNTNRLDGMDMTDDTIDAVSKALRRAWQLGQTYWKQADSHSYKQQDKSDETEKKFEALVDETRAMLAASTAAPSAEAGPHIDTTDCEDCGTLGVSIGANCPRCGRLITDPSAEAAAPSADMQDERGALLADYVELNMSNYGPDDVDELNAWGIRAYDFIDRAASTCANVAPAATVQAGEAIYQTATHVSNGVVWVDVTKEMYDAHFKFERRIVYAAPQPAQTAQSETTALEACRAIVKWCDENPPAGDALWCVQLARRAVEARSAQIAQAGEPTYVSSQATSCAKCGEHKHTPLRIDWMGGYVCLTCIDKELEAHDPALVLDDERAALPAMPSNVAHVTRRIRRCENETAAQLVLEHFAMEYARAASPQSTIDTPAKLARDAVRMLESYAESYESMAKMDSPSGDGTVQCRSVARDIRANMAGWFGAHLTEQATAAQQAQTERALTDDARDAVRYRYLRDQNKRMHYTTDYQPEGCTDLIQIEVAVVGEPVFTPEGHFDFARELDRAIDAVLTAAQAASGSNHV
jgi:hypothetical protein